MSSIRKSNIVFMGTPDFAVPSLLKLIEDDWQVEAVFTQPDRPKGRKRQLTPPPVKEAAVKLGIRVFQPEKLRSEEGIEAMRQLQPDLIVTAAYGQILPKEILEMPRCGCVNVHASLLPKYRGGAPIHHAIINGEKETGVTLMYMAEGLDTGDMIAQTKLPIEASDTVGTMFDKLKLAGAELLLEMMPRLAAGRVEAKRQNEAEATYAPNITRDDERIRWTDSALDVYNRVRGLNSWPVAFTTWNDERLKIWACADPREAERNTGHQTDAEPGTVLAVTPDGIDVATGHGMITITELQPAGKKRMTVDQFVRGTSLVPGERLGESK